MNTSTQNVSLRSSGRQGEERLDSLKNWIICRSDEGKPLYSDSKVDLAAALKAACDHISKELRPVAISLLTVAHYPEYSVLMIRHGPRAFNPPDDRREFPWDHEEFELPAIHLREKWRIVRVLRAAKREIQWLRLNFRRLENDMTAASVEKQTDPEFERRWFDVTKRIREPAEYYRDENYVDLARIADAFV